MALAARFAMLLVAHIAFGFVVPGPVNIASCVWEEGRLRVRWAAAPGALADYYEVQVATATDSQAFGIFSTGAEEADLDFLLPNSSYHLRLRAHAAGSPSLGRGTWGAVGSAVECRTGAAHGRPGAAAPAARGPSHRPLRSHSRVMEVMRESEFTYDVDYLMNHNSGNVVGDAAFLTMSSRANASGFLNVTFTNATFTLFCLEVLSVHIPGTTSTGGDDRFADYLSCNMGNDKSDPECECDNWIDRKIGHLDPDHFCHLPNGSTCADMYHGCRCNCSTASLSNSAKFTGMMPVFPGNHTDGWYWYSHPKASECTESEVVGARRKDGTVCTWKRRGDARVIRGWQALAQGWNISTGPHLQVSPAQVRQNAEAFRKAVSRQPLVPWSCAEHEASVPEELFV